MYNVYHCTELSFFLDGILISDFEYTIDIIWRGGKYNPYNRIFYNDNKKCFPTRMRILGLQKDGIQKDGIR